MLSFHSKLTATVRVDSASGRPLANEIRISIYTLRLELEGLCDIRGTFLACAPFLCHAHVKCFLAPLISHLQPSVGVFRRCFYSHTLCISCSQSSSSSHAIGRGETSNRAGLPQTALCDPSTRATAMGRWRMEPHTPTP